MRVVARFYPDSRRRRGLCPHRLHQGLDSDDLHHPFEVVGQHVQAHLRADARQGPCEEMVRAHPHFERCEGMLDSLSAQTHGVRRSIQPFLHSLDPNRTLSKYERTTPKLSRGADGVLRQRWLNLQIRMERVAGVFTEEEVADFKRIREEIRETA